MSQIPILSRVLTTSPATAAPAVAAVPVLSSTLNNLSSPYEVIKGPEVASSSSTTAVDVLSASYPRKGRKRKIGPKELHVPLGPSQTPRWSKQPMLKEITIVQDIAPQGLFTTSTTVPTFGSLSFLVNSLDNFASLAAVYDQYMIEEIQVLISADKPATNAIVTDSHLMSVVDVDDASAPTTLSQLGGYSTCVSSPGDIMHFHSWKPQFAIAAYSGVFTSFAATSGWVDCSSGTVQHYGLKYGATSTSTVISYSADIRYTVKFRSLH